MQSPIIFGRNALKDAAGSCTKSCSIFRNLLITREPALLSCSRVSESCCRVNVCSSCCTICSVTADPICTLRLSNKVKRKPRILSVVSKRRKRATCHKQVAWITFTGSFFILHHKIATFKIALRSNRARYNSTMRAAYVTRVHYINICTQSTSAVISEKNFQDAIIVEPVPCFQLFYNFLAS